jgi:hypothetical protein
MRKSELKKLTKAISFLYSDEQDSFTDGMNLLLELRNSALARNPTKHAPDVVESAASVSILPASEVSASEADSTPSTTQVM